ncbi:hypothetical protein [Pseudonocardia sp. TRM90224]|uniref:hypothetical protein n=1 Tax=Pseudonocardia sp. TRM90224 TaxID=2812678 RepID=UPI001E342661|nr:hypothetical protein [Pseudonocardia sp. TRM90224]
MKRPILRWLLWSPRRLLMLIAAAALIPVLATQLVAGICWLATAGSPSAPEAVSDLGPPAPAMTLGAEVVPVAVVPVVAAPPDAPSFGSPRVVAMKVARLWIDTTVDRQTWLRRLQPLCTPEYGLVVLPQIDPPAVPTAVPTAAVSDAVELVRVADRSVDADVDLGDGTAITIALVDITGTGMWRVNSVQLSRP